MKYRKVRIVWSTGCMILCELLVVRWLQSGGVKTTVLDYITWHLIALLSLFAVVPWLDWSPRFSLRLLLVAMTLMAIMLWAVAAYTK
jgi:hypothetical protein